MASSPITSWQIDEETVADFNFLGSKITADGDCSHEIKRHLLLASYDQPRQHIKKQRHYFVNKGPSSQGYGFSSSHVWVWGLDCKERWAPKNWCFWTLVLEKPLESPLDCKEIQPIHPKGDQSWVFIGRTDAEAETPILWPPDAESWLIWKDPDAGKDWRQEEKGTTGWNGWMASPTQGTWVWVDSGSWWWTGRPGVLRFVGLQRVRHDWATELKWIRYSVWSLSSLSQYFWPHCSCIPDRHPPPPVPNATKFPSKNTANQRFQTIGSKSHFPTSSPWVPEESHFLSASVSHSHSWYDVVSRPPSI